MTGDPEKDPDQTSGQEAANDADTDQQSHKNDVEASSGLARDTPTPDSFIVDWDGPDDPHNPFNWTNFKKYRQLVGMAVNTFLT